MADPVRTVLADDHPMYRQGVVETIKRWPEIRLVATCEDGREALERIRELKPQVALLDLRMPDLDGMAVLNAVTRDRLPTKVLFVSAEFDSESVYAALGSGASGFLSKDAEGQEICEAIVAVARGETVLDGKIQAAIAEGVRRRADTDRTLLSDREREMIRLTAEGLTAAQIGERVHLSPATVKTHLQHAYEKLGVGDRAAAVAEAMRRGLLE